MKNFVGFTLGCLFAFLSSGITPLMAQDAAVNELVITGTCLLYTSPSPRD